MKRSLLVVLALVGFGMPVWADPVGPVVTVTLLPGSQTLPVSTSATLTLGWELTEQPAAGAYTGTVALEYQIFSGPDAGSAVITSTFTFSPSDFDTPHSRTFSFVNDGTAGTDVVQAILFDGEGPFTFTSSTVDVTWSTPEAPSWLLLGLGVSVFRLLIRKNKLSNA
jgi:hypothetical protein